MADDGGGSGAAESGAAVTSGDGGRADGGEEAEAGPVGTTAVSGSPSGDVEGPPELASSDERFQARERVKRSRSLGLRMSGVRGLGEVLK